MLNAPPKYSGIVELGGAYRTPEGKEFVATRFLMQGIEGVITPGITVVVKRSVFATFVKI